MTALKGGKVDKVPFTIYESKIPQCAAEREMRNRGCCIVWRSSVYKSTKRGHTWRLLRDGFPRKISSRWTAPVGALAIDPNQPTRLYLGAGGNGVFIGEVSP